MGHDLRKFTLSESELARIQGFSGYSKINAVKFEPSGKSFHRGHRGSCPDGWHLPSDSEWEILMAAVGGSFTAGLHLKAQSGWDNDGNGTDDYGFSALPGGNGIAGSFNYVGLLGGWWSATDYQTAIEAHLQTLYQVSAILIWPGFLKFTGMHKYLLS